MTASFREQDTWQVSPTYPKEPGKDLNGSITTTLMVIILTSPVAILASHLKPSIAGREDITLITGKALKTTPDARNTYASLLIRWN